MDKIRRSENFLRPAVFMRKARQADAMLALWENMVK